MESKWDRYCVKCFNRLGDTAVHCNHCGYNYDKKHIEITGVHKKTNDFKNRKQWLGKTGEFIIETDFKLVKNTPIEAGWYGGYFIPDEPPHDVWLLNAIQYKEVTNGG